MAARKPRSDPQKNDLTRECASDLLYLLGLKDAELDPLLRLCLRRVTEDICSITNQPDIPPGLHMAAAYRAAGEYLYTKKASGGLAVEDIDFAAVDGTVRGITEGDVKVEFATGDSLTAEQRFDRLVDALRTAGEANFGDHRRLRW